MIQVQVKKQLNDEFILSNFVMFFPEQTKEEKAQSCGVPNYREVLNALGGYHEDGQYTVQARIMDSNGKFLDLYGHPIKYQNDDRYQWNILHHNIDHWVAVDEQTNSRVLNEFGIPMKPIHLHPWVLGSFLICPTKEEVEQKLSRYKNFTPCQWSIARNLFKS